MSRLPQIDPGSVGVSFVDILFALAVGQVFMPLASWAQDPAKSPLPLLSWFHLGVALTISITSWIGFHESANKESFRPEFVNVELVKLVLDIAMVAVYFMLAAYALRQPVSEEPETLLVVVAFVLYGLWDLACAYQKRGGSGNPYHREWDRVHGAQAAPGAAYAWGPTNWGRVHATWIGLAVALLLWAVTLVANPTTPAAVVIDVALLVLLVGYRLLKEFLASRAAPANPADHPAAPVGAGGIGVERR